MEERFIYNVVPRRPIRNLIKGKVVSRSENLSLTKDEVLYCLKFGAVYRKFYGETKMERVVPSNLDRLHRREHLSEKDYQSLSTTGHYVASGFFDTGDSGATDPIDKKKHSEPEEQFLPLGNQEDESVSSETDNIGFEQESSDNSIEEDIVNDTDEEYLEDEIPVTTSSVSSIEMDIIEEVDAEEYLEDEDEEDQTNVEEMLNDIPSNTNQQNQANNKHGSKKKRNRH